MSEYRSKRLIIGKTFIDYAGERVLMSQIRNAYQPQYRPAWVFFACFCAAVGITLLITGNLLTIGAFVIASIAFIVGVLTRPSVVKVKLNDGAIWSIDVSDERNRARALNAVLDSVQAHLDRIDGVSNASGFNPEEYVRQYVLKILHDEFGYSRSDIGYEVPIQLGSSVKRADVVVYHSGKAQTQDNIRILVECKRADTRDDTAAKSQLESYMSACVNARYGVVASYRWIVIEKTNVDGHFRYDKISALPNATGMPINLTYFPQTFDRNTGYSANDNKRVSEVNYLGFGNAVKYGLILGGIAGIILIGVLPMRSLTGTTRLQNTSAPATIRPTLRASISTPRPTFTVSRTSIPVVQELITATPQERTPDGASTLIKRTATELAIRRAETRTNIEVTPLVTESLELFAIVQSDQPVNVRARASTDSSVLATLDPDARVEVIGENADQTWLNVRLENGRTGWIAAFLLILEN